MVENERFFGRQLHFNASQMRYVVECPQNARRMHANSVKILGSLASSTTKIRHAHFCRSLPGSEPTRECEANAWRTQDEPAESGFLTFFFFFFFFFFSESPSSRQTNLC